MGYDLARFVRAEAIKELMPELICSICQDVFRKPMKIKMCEHVFCHECIDSWLSRPNQNCPICRVSVHKKRSPQQTSSLVAEDKMSSSILDKLKVFCVFKQHGCQVEAELCQLETHEKNCEFDPERLTDCEQGCGTKLPKSNLQQHSCIATLMGHIQELTRDNNSHKKRIDTLQTGITLLTTGLENMIKLTDTLKDMISQLYSHLVSANQKQSVLNRKLSEATGIAFKRIDQVPRDVLKIMKCNEKAMEVKFNAKMAALQTRLQSSSNGLSERIERAFTIAGIKSLQGRSLLTGPKLEVYWMDCIPMFQIDHNLMTVKMTFKWVPRDKSMIVDLLQLTDSVRVTICNCQPGGKPFSQNMFAGSTNGNVWPPEDLVTLSNLFSGSPSEFCGISSLDGEIRFEVAFPAEISTLEFLPT